MLEHLPPAAARTVAAMLADRRGGGGPAQDMIDYIEPLLGPEPNEEDMQRALSMGTICWNLSVTPEPEREQLLEKMVERVAGAHDVAAREVVRNVFTTMIARHQEMFPEEHGL
jgi:hypothetical protein